MKIKSLYVGLMAFAMLLVGASCSDDNTPSYSKNTVQNTELKNILIQKGYQFNENGNLLLDDLANNTTTLDLSGTKLSVGALAELTMFPNLKEVNLSNNGYGPAFDFSKLPQQITGVDLTKNEIYDYDNLFKLEIADNGNETITNLHTLTKLYLPTTAKENTLQLPRFYRQNGSAVDMKMEDASGSLQTYTTLREVPDEVLRNYLKSQFPDYFEGDKIDLDKRSVTGGATNNINFSYRMDNNVEGCTSLEGIQYIVEHPYWEGTTCQIEMNEVMDCPSLKIGSYVTLFQVENLNVKEIDLTGATILSYIQIGNVSGFERIDLSKSSIWGQRDIETEEDSGKGSSLIVYDCPSLKEILLPGTTGSLRVNEVDVEMLDALKTLDLTKFKMVRSLAIGDLPDSYNLQYPDLTEFNTFNGKTTFACSEKANKLQSTIDFVQKYYKGVDAANRKLLVSRILMSKNNKAAFWYR